MIPYSDVDRNKATISVKMRLLDNKMAGYRLLPVEVCDRTTPNHRNGRCNKLREKE